MNITFGNETANPLYYGAELVIEGKSAEVIEIPEETEEVKDYAFAGLKTIVEVIIPEVVEAIGTGSFTGCTGLENINIPESVKAIGEKAFKACTSLTSAILGKIIKPSRSDENPSLKEGIVGAYAFDSCTNLMDVTIGANITMIADSAFTNSNKINRIDCYAMLAPEIGFSTFESVVKDEAVLHVPAGYKDLYETAPVWREFSNIVDDLAVAEMVDIDKTEVSIVETSTLQLIADVSTGTELTWTSSNEEVATVSASGLVTALKPGSATIIATANNGARGFCSVTVTASPTGIDEIEGEEAQVRAEGGNIIAPEGSHVFDLNGRRVAATNLLSGIYIVRIPSGKAVKVMVD